MKKIESGVTLVEVLVVLVVFSVFTVSSWRALGSVLETEYAAKNLQEKLGDYERAFRRISADLDNSVSIGSTAKIRGSEAELEINRLFANGDLERVRYSLTADELIRSIENRSSYALVSNISRVEFEYLDSTHTWQETTEQLNEQRGRVRGIHAIRMLVSVQDGQEIERIFRVQ